MKAVFLSDNDGFYSTKDSEVSFSGHSIFITEDYDAYEYAADGQLIPYGKVTKMNYYERKGDEMVEVRYEKEDLFNPSYDFDVQEIELYWKNGNLCYRNI